MGDAAIVGLAVGAGVGGNVARPFGSGRGRSGAGV
jgi:hypothetical protein